MPDASGVHPDQVIAMTRADRQPEPDQVKRLRQT